MITNCRPCLFVFLLSLYSCMVDVDLPYGAHICVFFIGFFKISFTLFFCRCLTEGFIVLAIESFWTRLFSQYFVCIEDDTRDDLLFYVKGKNANKDGKVTKEVEVQCMQFMNVLCIRTCMHMTCKK